MYNFLLTCANFEAGQKKWNVSYSCNGMKRNYVVKALTKYDAIKYAKSRLGNIKVNKVTPINF